MGCTDEVGGTVWSSVPWKRNHSGSAPSPAEARARGGVREGLGRGGWASTIDVGEKAPHREGSEPITGGARPAGVSGGKVLVEPHMGEMCATPRCASNSKWSAMW